MIPERWYPVFEAAKLRKKPVALERLGERLVLWRQADGSPVAMRDRCPHRGAALSLGKLEGGTLACRYHGFRFDSEGQCVLMPCEGAGAKIPRGMEVAVHPVREGHGLIWLFWGEAAHEAELPPLPWFDDLPLDQPSADMADEWDLPYERLIESHFDLHHFPFVHRSAGGFSVGARLDPYEVVTEGDAIRTRGELRRDDQAPGEGFPFRVDFVAPNLTRFQVGKGLVFLAATTPIDAERSWLFVRYWQGWVKLPLLGRLVSWIAMQVDMRIFQYPQDLPVLRSLEPRHTGPGVNRFVGSDAGSAAWIKLRERLREGSEKDAAMG
jgi:phenylpropionate dioxygenase-like ring-hydroxylating dioxygenase large terminal subunit